MKLVGWDEFRTLPEGTIFQDWAPHHLGKPMILGEVLERDYVAADLLPRTQFGSTLEDGHPLREEDMIICMPSGFGRDGLYDVEKRHWLVWEKADRERLSRWLLDPVAAVQTQNDDDQILVVPSDIAADRLSSRSETE